MYSSKVINGKIDFAKEAAENGISESAIKDIHLSNNAKLITKLKKQNKKLKIKLLKAKLKYKNELLKGLDVSNA